MGFVNHATGTDISAYASAHVTGLGVNEQFSPMAMPPSPNVPIPSASSPPQFMQPQSNVVQNISTFQMPAHVPSVMPWSVSPSPNALVNNLFTFSCVNTDPGTNVTAGVFPSANFSANQAPVLWQSAPNNQPTYVASIPFSPPSFNQSPNISETMLNSSHSNISTTPMPSNPFITSTSPLVSDRNHNHKRPIAAQDDIELNGEFDFITSRPIKKYISEDKVLEIFDRLHIRESNHYIVEEVDDIRVPENGTKHDVEIKMLDEAETECVLELSPELKDAFQCSTITDKLAAHEKDKITKALVIWKPNPNLRQSTTAQKDESNEQNLPTIEEVLSDDEEMNNECDSDSGFIIEQLNEDDTIEMME